MDLVHLLAQAYAEQFTSPEDDLLAQVNRQTREQHAHAHMLSGHLQGKFLEMISTLLRPARILEIGTFTGYSALCLAKGLVPGGRLHTIECRVEEAAKAQENFNKSPYRDNIQLYAGNALDIIPQLQETWDLVFIDADKVNYTAYYKLVLPGLRSGGIILADNVLFHGEVLQPVVKGKNALAIHAFNEYVRQDGNVDKLLLTIRDGLMMIIKK
ncbi:MAG TPA: O-methyltransferase [Chitinophagaceae bacterium]|jgi:predicted O-methyltransferase YrrM